MTAQSPLSPSHSIYADPEHMVAKADRNPDNNTRAGPGNHGHPPVAEELAGLAMRNGADRLPPDYKGEGSEVAYMAAVRPFYKTTEQRVGFIHSTVQVSPARSISRRQVKPFLALTCSTWALTSWS